MFRLLFIIALLNISAESGVDLGIRWLKLGNTYREAREFNKAEELLKKGRDILKNGSTWKHKYWTTVSDEYLGLLYNSVSRSHGEQSSREYFKQLALEHLTRAVSSYKNLIKIKDGSPYPLEEIIKNLDALESMIPGKAIASSNVLNYEKLKLRDIPRGIPSNVVNLSLAENKFSSFPSGLTNYKSLKYLNLSDNKIRDVGPDIEQITSLIWLDLSDNKLADLPDQLCNLYKLEYLDLSNNKLKKLPACICQMENLKILNLKNNKLPYSEIANIVKCLPNTNIFIDEYKLIDNNK